MIFELPHALYPFRLAELGDFRFGPYRLLNVFRRITDEQRHACVQMWLDARVLPSEEAAWQRSREICYLFLHAAGGGLAGVNTAYVARYPARDAPYFFNRMFICPAYRDSRLMIAGTTAAICYLRTHHWHEGVRGVININQNPKLFRPSVRQVFERVGYRLDGRTNSTETWRYEFDDVQFVDRPPAHGPVPVTPADRPAAGRS